MAILSGGLITLLTRQIVHNIIIEQVQKRGLAILEDMKDDRTMTDGFIQKSEKKLLEAAQAVQQRSEAVYAVALDPSGGVLAHTNVMEKGKIYSDGATAAALRSTKPGTQQIYVNGNPLLDVFIPVWKPSDNFLFDGQKDLVRLGTIRMGIPLQDALDTQARITRQVLWIVTGIGTLVLVVGFILMRSILLPVQLLAKATEKIVQGQYGVEVPVFSQDEVGELANSFNLMSRTLEKNIVLLRDAQDKVVRSEKLAAIGQLASGVGHELRNPLGAIRNVVYYLRDTLSGSPVSTDDPATMEMLELADREIRSAVNIISDLLDFSRVVRLTVQPSDVASLVREAKAAVEIPSGIAVSIEHPKNLPPAVVDPMRMRQVFVNLFLNSIQAMPRGGSVDITLSVESNNGDAPWMRVDIRDNGIGIPQENIRKIFEPLFSTKAKGTGLGLAICQGIVEAHGGHILVASDPEKGSTFTVRTPLGGPRHGNKPS